LVALALLAFAQREKKDEEFLSEQPLVGDRVIYPTTPRHHESIDPVNHKISCNSRRDCACSMGEDSLTSS